MEIQEIYVMSAYQFGASSDTIELKHYCRLLEQCNVD